MSKKVSITLDDEVLDFVDQRAENRSSFINHLLREHKEKVFLEELEEAYREQSSDPEFREEVSVWDATVGDGLNA